MKLTKEEALRYHRQMWTDMQCELGDCPTIAERSQFKTRWCEKHNWSLSNDCFLCEYDLQLSLRMPWARCEHCPIDWGFDDNYGYGCEYGKVKWDSSPISEILALPVKEDV